MNNEVSEMFHQTKVLLFSFWLVNRFNLWKFCWHFLWVKWQIQKEGKVSFMIRVRVGNQWPTLFKVKSQNKTFYGLELFWIFWSVSNTEHMSWCQQKRQLLPGVTVNLQRLSFIIRVNYQWSAKDWVLHYL